MFWLIKPKTLLFLFFLSIALISPALANENWGKDWKEARGDHFIILYSAEESSLWASEVLREAEKFYDKIADQIGYARYQNFWTWEERVKIIVFADQPTFVRETGQPAWARGGAGRDEKVLKSRIIITYKQEQDFLDGVLPHEITHLILRDFFGEKTVPIWFEEGMAQFQEKNRPEVANKFMRFLVVKNIYMPFNYLVNSDVRFERDSSKVMMFYAQSISILDFLMQKYGMREFAELCRNMREGLNFEEALTTTYRSVISSLSDLEEKWLNHMKQ